MHLYQISQSHDESQQILYSIINRGIYFNNLI